MYVSTIKKCGMYLQIKVKIFILSWLLYSLCPKYINHWLSNVNGQIFDADVGIAGLTNAYIRKVSLKLLLSTLN